ncbi:MAG: hypothetical protein K0U74_17455 [Alphaproteobacteria bacterium]|nr:hypothetical protein [Alphaproteobacteria bacterium]
MAEDNLLRNEQQPREMPDLDGSPQTADDLPSPDDSLPEVIIYSHSGLIYWWPVCVTGFVCGLITYAAGRPFTAEGGETLYVYPGTGLGLTYITVFLLTLLITSARLRGIYSVVALLTVGLITVTLAWAGLLDDLARIIPQLSVHMNAGFYMATSISLAVILLATFFYFDRLTYRRVRPGQLTEEKWIGDGAESFDARGMLFEKHGEDFMRHKILGFGSGDLRLTTAGAKKRTISIPDVLFVDKTVSDVQRLIAIEPTDLLN